MDIKIKRMDATLPLPQFETKGSVGFDLIARQRTFIEPKRIALIPANVIVQVPEDYMLQISLRSSTPRKLGLIMPHGVGIIDQDYCGPEDEIQIQVYNFTEGPSLVERGARIAQGIFVNIGNSFGPGKKGRFVEVDEISEITRGGFGSTDDSEGEVWVQEELPLEM